MSNLLPGVVQLLIVQGAVFHDPIHHGHPGLYLNKISDLVLTVSFTPLPLV